MAALSGKFGALATDPLTGPNAGLPAGSESTVRNWRITNQTNAPSYRASNTLLGTGRVTGIEDWTGSFEEYGIVPKLFPGDKFVFFGYTAPDTPFNRGDPGIVYTGNAIVNEVAMTWNWRNNEIPQTTVSFESDGFLSQSTSIIQDITVPQPTPICGLRVEYNYLDQGYVVWPNVASVSFTLRTENPTIVNSSTIDPGSGRCFTSRTRGPLDFDLDILEDNNDTNLPVPISGDTKIRVITEVFPLTKYWQIEWAHIDGYSDLTVDPETGRVIENTVNLKMNGFVDGDVGAIVDPNLLVRWPFE